MSLARFYKTERILGQDHFVSNDPRTTNLNLNDVLVGSPGSGKTRSYVIPNIMQANSESMIITDTKGNLIDLVGPILKKRKYKILHIDFKTMETTARYNPLEYIHYDEGKGVYSEKDIIKLAETLVPIHSPKEPFWDYAARQYLSLLVAWVLDNCPEEEHSLSTVMVLFRIMDEEEFLNMMNANLREKPDSFAARLFTQIRKNFNAEKMHASIMGILGEHLTRITFDAALTMYNHPNRFRIRDLAKEKTALFLTISDTDRSMDDLLSLFYRQAMQDLCDYADLECEGQRLPVPVRFFMDDFATNAYVEDMDNVCSVIRSREIYVSIILQSLSQLDALYGSAKASTILEGCDNLLYLGGSSLQTAQYIAQKANLPLERVLNMPLDKAILFTRGQNPRTLRKFDIRTHSRYKEFLAAQQSGKNNKKPAGAEQNSKKQDNDSARAI